MMEIRDVMTDAINMTTTMSSGIVSPNAMMMDIHLMTLLRSLPKVHSTNGTIVDSTACVDGRYGPGGHCGHL